MKLWNKNDHLNKKIEKFTVGNDRIYDLYIAKYDIKASIVHAKMLNKSKIISNNEMNLIVGELNVLNTQILKGDFIIEDEFEDIHSKIEFILTKKLGDIGKKIHTGR